MNTNEYFAPQCPNADGGNGATAGVANSARIQGNDRADVKSSVAGASANTLSPAVRHDGSQNATTIDRQPVWVDLLSPTSDEIDEIEERYGIEVPTREEMQEIELSSRLYEEDGALFMTVSVLNRATTDVPQTAAVTFILVKETLITLRYADPVPFKTFIRRAKRNPSLIRTAETVLFGLLEQIVDRLADLMEQAAADLEALSIQVFTDPDGGDADRNHRETLRQIGRTGNLSGKAKDSLLNLHRLCLFLAAQTGMKKNAKERFKVISRDIVSITEHANFIANKVTFLLDATLGMINLEQNNIIKIFSVVAVAFLPPTLIASIYGMNFELMPELRWEFGYPVAIGLMILSAVLPLLYFKRKGWL